MSGPKVSICMPTLNSEAFLAPRLASIRRQTLTDWELVVVDSQSDDATLAMVDVFAEQGGTVRVYQGPRDGIYTNINRSIEYAQGKYVYIATSDDTMADDCLEKMAHALDQHENCGLAHCPLRILDAQGEQVQSNWWDARSTFVRSAKDALHTTHTRKAPYDGMLHMLGETVYTSLTQILIRRGLFDRIGMFRSDWGSISDFYWDMRASLTTDTVHVGDTWASWRVHDTQATASADVGQSKHTAKIDDMIETALDDSMQDLPEQIQSRLADWRREVLALRRFLDEVKYAAPGPRRRFLCSQLLLGSAPARRYLMGKMTGRESLPEDGPKVIEQWLASVGLVPMTPVTDG